MLATLANVKFFLAIKTARGTLQITVTDTISLEFIKDDLKIISKSSMTAFGRLLLCFIS